MNVLKLLSANVQAAGNINITYRDGANVNNSTTITAPSGIVEGDILFFFDRALNTSGAPTAVIPSGFTQISNITLGNRRQIVSYKVADGTEAGATITGMASTSANAKRILAFSTGVSSPTATVQSINEQITNAAPSNQTITCGSSSSALIAVSYLGQTTLTSYTFTPTEDDSYPNNTNNNQIKYKIYNTSPANVTVTAGDGGNENALQSFYVEVD